MFRDLLARPAAWCGAVLLPLALTLGTGLAGCSSLSESLDVGPQPARDRALRDAEIFSNAQRERVRYLEREVERLHADLLQAEAAMVAIESGLRGVHTRADAVSSLAEARIAVERAERRAPWRHRDIEEAHAKLEEAERQFQQDHAGSAVFFASRAQRIAETLDEEARLVERHAGTRFVKASQVNLRAGPSTGHRVISVLPESTPVFPERNEGSWVLVRTPSGPVGWVHASLLGGP